MNIGHPRTLWLVRHGESAGNIANAAATQAQLARLDLGDRDMDVPLSLLGAQQARALGKWLGNQARLPGLLLTSPYERAVETMRIAAETAGWTLPLVCDERLREREFGVFDRLTRLGIEQLYPEESARRTFVGKFYHRPPGGESWADVGLRIRSVFQDLRLNHSGQDVLIVAHQAVILMARYVLEGMDEATVLRTSRENDLVNTSVTTYEGDGINPPQLVTFNEAAHLSDELTTVAPDLPTAPR